MSWSGITWGTCGNGRTALMESKNENENENDSKLYPFEQLTEGEQYQIVGYPENSKEVFTIRRGLLYSLTENKYSNYKSSDIISFRFVEYEEPNEPIEIPVEFYNFLGVISSKFKYVAKDRYEKLVYLYVNKPTKNENYVWMGKGGMVRINSLFDYELNFLPYDRPLLIDDLKDMFLDKIAKESINEY